MCGGLHPGGRVESGEILPLQQILQALPELQQARILEVELEREHGRYVYEVEILTGDGRVQELQLDAASGELLRRRDDD